MIRWGVPAALVCLAVLVAGEKTEGLDSLWKWLAVGLIVAFAGLFAVEMP